MNHRVSFNLKGQYILFSILFIVLFTGCLQTRNDIKEAEATETLQSQISILQKNNADYVSRVEESLENYRQMNGRLEVLENKLHVNEKDEDQKKSSENALLSDLKEKINLLQDALGKHETEIQNLKNELSNAKMVAPANGKSKVSHGGGGGEDAAKNLFQSAEALFKDKKWKEAILQYDEYRNKFPNGKQASEAAYKTGVCFQELGLKDDAKTFYQEIINKYPKTEMARKAQIRLKSL